MAKAYCLLVCLAIGVIWLIPTHSLATDNEKAKISKAAEKIRDSFDKEARPVRVAFRDLMIDRQRALQNEGNFDAVKSITQDIEAFDRSNQLPDCVPTSTYRKGLTVVYEKHLAKFQPLLIKYTKAGKLNLAEEVESERDAFTAKFRKEYPGALFERKEWVHTTGRFVKVNEVEWVEFTDHGRIPFREAARDFDGIMLVNNQTTIWLLDERCDAKNGKKKRGVAFRGRWKN